MCSPRGNYVHLSWSRVKNIHDQPSLLGSHFAEETGENRFFLAFSLALPRYASPLSAGSGISLNDALLTYIVELYLTEIGDWTIGWELYYIFFPRQSRFLFSFFRLFDFIQLMQVQLNFYIESFIIESSILHWIILHWIIFTL